MADSLIRVVFYIGEVSPPYRLNLANTPEEATLQTLKEALDKIDYIPEGPYNYMFKFKCEEDGIAFRDILKSDDAHLPIVDGKVTLWLQKLERKDGSKELPSSASSLPSLSGDMNSLDNLDASLFPKSAYYLIKDKPNDLRRQSYTLWANHKKLRRVFKNTFKDIRTFTEDYFLIFEGKESESKLPPEDILLEIPSKSKLKSKSPSSLEPVQLDIAVKINDFPLSSVVNVPESVLKKSLRDFPSSVIETIGLQHVVISSTSTDSENSGREEASEKENEESDTSDQSDKSDGNKKQAVAQSENKIGQIALKLDYDNEFHVHERNSTKSNSYIEGALVDILIFISSRAISTNLADYLGLICLEDAVRPEVKAVTFREMLQTRFGNSKAKSYRLLQNVIARKLMFGRSNICITSNFHLFQNVKAQLKSIIYLKSEERSNATSALIELSNVEIMLEKPYHIMKYVTAINKIVDISIGVNSEIPVRFLNAEENECYDIFFPLYSIIPLYVLKFFAQLMIKDPKNFKLSFNSLE